MKLSAAAQTSTTSDLGQVLLADPWNEQPPVMAKAILLILSLGGLFLFVLSCFAFFSDLFCFRSFFFFF